MLCCSMQKESMFIVCVEFNGRIHVVQTMVFGSRLQQYGLLYDLTYFGAKICQ